MESFPAVVKTPSQNVPDNDINSRGNYFATKGLKCFHLNIHYLYPKLFEIKHLLSKYKEIDILGLCETFLNEYFFDNELELTNYQLFRKDRNSHGGGIVLYVKSEHFCNRRHDLEQETIESIWVEVKCPKQKPFILGYIYRPPSSLSSWNDEIENCLEKFYTENKEVILFGDFNYNFTNNSSSNSAWNDIITTHNLQQLVETHTRVTPHSATIIDHIYTNKPSNIIQVTVPELSISDHYPVCFTAN